MSRFILFSVLAFSACGSRTEYDVSTANAVRESSGVVVVTVTVGVQHFGTAGTDVASEVCVLATWAPDTSVAADAGTSTADAGTFISPKHSTGATIATARACMSRSALSDGFELRSSEAIPAGTSTLITLVPSESDASRASRGTSTAPLSFRDAQIASP